MPLAPHRGAPAARGLLCRAQVELLYARGQWPGEYGLQAVAPSGSEAHWAKALALAEAWRHWAVQPHAACASVPPSIDAAAQEALQALGCTAPGEGSATFAALLGCTPGAVSCPPVACLSLADASVGQGHDCPRGELRHLLGSAAGLLGA